MERKDGIKFIFDETDSSIDSKKYHVVLEVPMNVGWIDSSVLVIEGKRYPMKFVDNRNGYAVFDCDISLKQRAIYKYHFEYYVHGNTYYVTNKNTKRNIEYDEENKISVMFSVPEWAKGAVMYHIFVDRFYRGSSEELPEMRRREIHKSWDEDVVLGNNQSINKHYSNEEVWNVDFYGGDLKGIVKKLDYIKSLGVNLLYLSPIVFSQSNHRYDANDYEMVDPYAGSNDDLKVLCDEAHKRGIRILLDGVFNHVGDESKYFDRYHEHGNGSFENYYSPYGSFFKYDKNGKNTFWWDFENMPELNCDGEFWRNYICGEGGVIDKWFSLGIDGIRLDVADNLSDYALEGIYKAVIRNKKDGFILGEVWDNPMRVNRSYIYSGKSMHSVMNYPLVDSLVRYFKYQDPGKLSYILRDIQAEYPKDTIDSLMNFTSTHDISRIITLLGTKRFDTYHKFNELDSHLKDKIYESLWELGFSNEDLYALLNGAKEIDYYQYNALMERLSWKGISQDTINYLRSILSFSPFDRYQKYAKDLPEDIKKDLNYTRNYKLTSEEYAKAKEVYEAYLLFLAAYPGIMSIFYGDEVGMEGLNNLANRRPFPWGREDNELLNYVRLLGNFREKYPFLKDADFNLIDLCQDKVLFERVGEEKKIIVAINNTDSDNRIILPDEYRDGKKVLTLKRSNKNVLGPYGGIIIEK